jgi:hypothetical protein
MFVFFRLVSLILITIGLMLLGADAVTSLEKGGQIFVRSLEDVWALVGNVQGFKDWCGYYLGVTVSGWVYSMLTVPGWAITGVIGVVLAFIFGRRTHD